jgi:hypothetical protein
MRWLIGALVLAAALPIATWYGLYRFAGYGTWTVVAAQLAGLTLAAALVTLAPIGWGRLGLGWARLRDALVVGAAAYGAIVGLGAAMNALGANLALWRSSYELWPLVDNWLLTAFGEELLFAGVFFWLVRARLPRDRRYLAVPIVAALFALSHLPGYLAIGHEGGALLGRLGLNLVSWLIFGTIYALSGNLWLVVIAHAATDYGVSPLVTNEPVLGLVFMAVLIVGSWLLRRREAARPAPHAPTPAT